MEEVDTIQHRNKKIGKNIDMVAHQVIEEVDIVEEIMAEVMIVVDTAEEVDIVEVEIVVDTAEEVETAEDIVEVETVEEVVEECGWMV